MKNMQTPSHRFMAVKLETTGNLERNLEESICMCTTYVYFMYVFVLNDPRRHNTCFMMRVL